MVRPLLCALALGLGACRGIDECGGQGSALLEVGASDAEMAFVPWSDGEALSVTYGAEGQSGVELAMRTRGLDTRDAVTITVELEVAGYLQQLVADTALVCDNEGHGRLRVFGDLPHTVAQDVDTFDGAEVYLQVTLVDAHDRVVDGDPLFMDLQAP